MGAPVHGGSQYLPLARSGAQVAGPRLPTPARSCCPGRHDLRPRSNPGTVSRITGGSALGDLPLDSGVVDMGSRATQPGNWWLARSTRRATWPPHPLRRHGRAFTPRLYPNRASPTQFAGVTPARRRRPGHRWCRSTRNRRCRSSPTVEDPSTAPRRPVMIDDPTDANLAAKASTGAVPGSMFTGARLHARALYGAQ